MMESVAGVTRTANENKGEITLFRVLRNAIDTGNA